MKKFLVLVLLLIGLTTVAMAEEPLIKIGDYNEDVIKLHQKLSDLGYYDLRPESPWSSASEEAVWMLQFNTDKETTGIIVSQEELDEIFGLEKVIGKNLLADSNYYIEKDNKSGLAEQKMITVSKDMDLQELIGKTITISIYVNAPGERGNSMGDSTNYLSNRFGCHGYFTWRDSSGVLGNKDTFPCTDLLSQSVTEKRLSSSFTVIPPEGYDTLIYAAVAVQYGAKPAEGNEEIWSLGYPKLEIGSNATEWN